MAIAAGGSVLSGRLTVAEIAIRVKRQFGDEVGSQITNDDVIRWINDAQRDIAIKNNLLQVKATNDILTGQSDYPVPENILDFHSIKYNGTVLTGLSIQEADDFTDSTTVATGTPTHYWHFASTLTLYPTPDTNINSGLKLFYYRQPTAVVNVEDIPELPAQYHNRLVDYCIAQAYELDSDMGSYQAKMGMFMSGIDALRANSQQQPQVATYPVIAVATADAGYDAGY